MAVHHRLAGPHGAVVRRVDTAALGAMLHDNIVIQIAAPARRPRREMILQRMTVQPGILASYRCQPRFKTSIVVAERPDEAARSLDGQFDDVKLLLCGFDLVSDVGEFEVPYGWMAGDLREVENVTV